MTDPQFSPPQLTPPVLAKAAQLFVAAFGALAMATVLGLQNPFWAAMPVWVVAQAYRQDLVIRGVLRVLGTLVGALIGWIVLTQITGAMPQVALFALGVGFATLTAFLIGTVYSYGAMIVAITLAVVMLPGLDHRLASGFVMDRIYCTLIGVVAVTVITFAFTPPRPEAAPLRVNHGASAAVKRGARAFVAAVLAGALVTYWGGPAALAAAMAVVVFSAIIGSMPDPTPVLDNLLPGTALGVLAAVVYRGLVIWLGLDGLDLLWLAAPFIALGAVVRSAPRTAGLGLDFNMVFLLAAEASAHGRDLTTHVIMGVTLFAGGAAVVYSYRGRAMFAAATKRAAETE